MGAGRKPTPTRLKMVRGNPGKRPLNTNEPQPVTFLTNVAPDWFSDLEAELWAAAIESAPPKLLSSMDGGVLTTFVVAAAMHQRATVAQADWDADHADWPLLAKNSKGMYVKSPYVTIIKEQAAIMIKAASELGFTPSSRSRISLPSTPDNDSEFDGF